MKNKYSSLLFAISGQLGFILLAIQIFASNHILFSVLGQNVIIYWTLAVVSIIIILILLGVVLEVKEINKD